MKLSRYLFTIVSLTLCMQIMAQSSDRDCIRMGNKYFRDGDYNKAETYYRKALDMNKSLEAFYNLGNAIIPQGKDSVAFEQYKKALEQIAETPEKKAYVYHNMGNLSYLTGRNLMKANSPDAMKSFEQAVDLYKSALRCNPADNETRYNLAMAQYMLKKNQQNQDQNQQNQNQNQDQNKDQDKKDQQKDKQDQGDNKQNQDKDQDKKDQQNKDQQNQQNQQNKDQQEKKQQQQPAEPQKPQMDDKTAEQLLNSAQQDEKAVQQKVQKAEKAYRQGLEKDW
ncbi:MAG: tetratricopeptide repeat protein [Bacteroidaceae bacterium]|nr:tetratricopeptide repeat protein [Bacteroidaceae bacterium]